MKIIINSRSIDEDVVLINEYGFDDTATTLVEELIEMGVVWNTEEKVPLLLILLVVISTTHWSIEPWQYKGSWTFAALREVIIWVSDESSI